MAKLARWAHGIEVFSRREGMTLHLVSRLRPRGLLLALGLTMVIASSAIALVDSRLEPFRLECSRTGDRCTLSVGRRTIERFPISRTLRFEVRPARRQWELVAVTEEESIGLIWGARKELAGHAADLNEYLRDPLQDRYELENDPRAALRATMRKLLPVMTGLCVLALLMMAKDRVTIFDRAHGLAVRQLSLLPSRRRLDRFRAIAVRALGDERQPWYMRSSAYQRGGPWRRIVLVEEGGASWGVTPFQNQQHAGSSDLDAVAAELASYLGLPLTTTAPGSGAPRARF